MMSTGADGSGIAVIGMVGRFPGARDLGEFWRNLRDGKESIRFLSDQELVARGLDPAALGDSDHVRAVAELDDPDSFDAEFFGISHREAEIMDPQQRIFLECAWQALESAGYRPDDHDGAIALFAGATASTYLVFNLVANSAFERSWDPLELLVANAGDSLATRVSYKLNLKGPSFTVQCACSTSLVAVHLACESLLAEQCDLALAGGISINVAQRTGYRYQEGSIASPDGHCRPFDAGAQGTVFGSGVGIVVLKRLAEAVADGDPIRAVILGSAVNNDGAVKVGYTAPSVEGQSEVISEALSVADVPAESISYVEAHGTATNLGDPIEIQALTRTFRSETDKTGFCAIGSVKSNVGHLDIAAGISGLIKTILALEHRQIPPSLHFEEPNPKIDFARSPVYVNTDLRDWPTADGPRRAGVSSFGFGGTNAHLIVEEAPVLPPSGASRPWQLLDLSARSREALDEATSNLADHLRSPPELELAAVAYTLAVGRKNFLHRRTGVGRDPEEAAALLAGRVLTRTDTQDPRQRPVVFMFTGQGAQYVNMGRELYDREPVFRDAVDRCAQRLELLLGWDLRPVLYPPPEADPEEAAERLRQTAVTQMALFVVEYALAALWQEWGIRPAAMIGHSIGEYVAAHLAGVFSLDDALAVVAARGRLMQEAPPGAMLSVPLAEKEVQALLTPELALAAVNGPARCVVSGPETALDELASRLAARGVEPRRLHTSHAFHSAMMEPVLERFAAELRQVRLQPPEIPYLSNLTGTWVTAQQATDPSYWVRHLRQTVRFGAGLAELAKEPERILLEVGPGQTLTQLARRQLGDQVVVASMRPPREPEASDLAVLLTALGHLWLAGREIEWPRFFGPARRRRLPLPTYPFTRRSYWIEPDKAAARPAARVDKKTAIEDWFYLPAWRPTLPPAKWGAGGKAEAGGRWLIFADDGGLGATLGAELRKAGGEVFTVTAGTAYARRDGHGFVVDPDRSEDYDLLFADIFANLGRAVTGIVHLWTVDRPPGAGFDRAQQRGYYSLLYLAQTLDRQAEADPIRILVAATDVLAVSGPDACPEKATLIGPALVLSQELPHVSCRLVDPELADDPGPACARLLAELAAESSDPIVAYRGPRRLVPSFEPVRLAAGGPGRRLREGEVYLITGGLGPTGLQIAEILASQLRPRLILVDDGPFPERAQWESHQDGDGTIGRLLALEKTGAQLVVTAADVADPEQLEAVMRSAEERFGPLAGLIHAAGAAAGQSVYRPLAALSRADSEEHFRRTARAARALEQVVAERRLDFVLLFTSTAAVLGGLGLAATAAADRFINALATARPAGGTEWISAGWDHWPAPGEEGAVGASTDELAMTAEERREAFLRLLAQAPEGQIVVSTGDLAARVRRWLERVPARPERPGALHDRPDLATDYVAPRTPLEREIAAVWQDLLGTREVGIDDNFFDLGGDSFLAVQVVSRLRKALGRDLPVVSLYEGLTVKALADLLAREEDEAAAREETIRELEEARSRRREYQRRRRAVKREGLGFSPSGLSED